MHQAANAADLLALVFFSLALALLRLWMLLGLWALLSLLVWLGLWTRLSLLVCLS